MPGGTNKDLFFIALVIGGEPGSRITRLKQEMERDFNSRRALNSPPHITLVPPFKMEKDRMDSELAPALFGFAGKWDPVDLQLDGFGAFKPRVIFVKPSASAELEQLYQELRVSLKAMFPEIRPSEYPFHPHVTIAFRDLAADQFYKAWPLFRDRSFSELVHFQNVTVLRHVSGKWTTYLSCPLRAD